MRRILYIISLLLPSLIYAAPAVSAEQEEEEYKFNPVCWMPVADRINRKIEDNVFVFKGELAAGINASYFTLNADNTSYLTLLEGIDIDGIYASITPYIGYFYRNNRYVGLRMGYSYVKGDLNSTTIDLGSSNDLSFDIPYVGMESKQYNISAFHRAYTGLDRKGRLGLYAELELAYARGYTTFGYQSIIKKSTSDAIEFKFNPGIAVFIFPNICSTLSFGLGGLSYTQIKQFDDEGKVVGQRTSSDFDLKINVLDINLGIVIHFWKKDKK